MPYALSNLVNGQEPSYRSIASADDAAPGEVVVDNVPAGYVWDSATQSLRPRTAAEQLTLNKDRRIAEIRNGLNYWYLQDVRSVEGDVTVYKKATGAVLTAEETSIFNTVNSNYTKRNTAIASVKAATTIAQVDAIAVPTWDRVT